MGRERGKTKQIHLTIPPAIPLFTSLTTFGQAHAKRQFGLYFELVSRIRFSPFRYAPLRKLTPPSPPSFPLLRPIGCRRAHSVVPGSFTFCSLFPPCRRQAVCLITILLTIKPILSTGDLTRIFREAAFI